MSGSPDSHPPVSRWRRRLFERLFDFRWLVVGLAALVAVVCAAAGTGLVWREDVMDLLPKSDPVVAQYQRILTDFGQLDALLVLVGTPAGAPPRPERDLIDAADRLAERMRASGLFKSLTYHMDASDFSSALDVLREHRARLFTPEDEAALRARLAPGAVLDILAGWKRQLTETPAPFLAQALARDPLGMDELLLAKLTAAQSLDGPVVIEQGRLFSRDRRHLLLLAAPTRSATDGPYSQRLVAFMDRAVREVEGSLGTGTVAYLSGHRFSLENASRIKGDIGMTLTLSFLAIALISLAVYRRPLWIGLTFLPTLFGGAFALGALRLLVPDISAIAIGCGSMLLGVAVDLGIHILYHIDQITDDRPRKDQIIEILDRLFWPLILCSATTIVAFFALEWSVLPGYQSLGHFAVLGFTGATVFAIFVLPLLVPLRAGSRPRAPLVPVARIFPALFIWSTRHRTLVMGFLAVSLLACLPGLLRLRFEGDYQQMNAVSPRVKQDWDRIAAVFGSAMPSTSVVVRGGDLERSLGDNERLYALLQARRAAGGVQTVHSLAPLLPSAASQEVAARRWHDFWSGPRIDALRASLEKAAAELRMRPGAFAPFLAGLTAEPPPLTPEDLQRGLLRHLVSRHLAEGAPGVPVLTSVELAPGTDFEGLFASLRASGLRFTSFHGPDFMGHVARLVQREMLWVSAITIPLVVLILVLYYRVSRDLFLVLLPLAVGLLWTFGIMGWLDLRVNLMNSLIVVFVFGVVVDYSLFLVTALRHSKGLDDPLLADSSVGITVSAVTTMIGLGALVAARHPALHSIGLTSLLGIGTGLLAVFTIIPLHRGRRSGGTPDEESDPG
ncbi:MAG: MMPL family transporter [Deltaproteobacteria bacterium]|nr:MMPL family transporter [Deltaproteobacteria bacterium]